MELVKTPLYIPNPKLDENGWNMQDKYKCDCSQVSYTLRFVSEYLKLMLSERLLDIFGERYRVLCKQVEENIWMRVFLPWTYLGYEQCRSDQLVYVKKCRVPIRDKYVLDRLAKDFKLGTPPPYSSVNISGIAELVFHGLVYELREHFNLLTFDDCLTSVDVSEDLELVEDVREDPASVEEVREDLTFEYSLASVNLAEDLELVEEVNEDLTFEDSLTYVDVMEDLELVEKVSVDPLIVDVGEDLIEVKNGAHNISLIDSGYVLV